MVEFSYIPELVCADCEILDPDLCWNELCAFRTLGFWSVRPSHTLQKKKLQWLREFMGTQALAGAYILLQVEFSS